MDGSNLMKGVDGGGNRWYLDGEPVHAGTGLELLLELEPKYDSDTGDVVDFKPLWLPVRLEFDYDAGKSLVHWPAHGPNEMRSEVPEGTKFRWPKK